MDYLRILTNIYEGLMDKLEFSFHTEVASIEKAEDGYRLILARGGEVFCKYLLAAPGRSGAEWFSNQCKGLGLELLNNQVDIGVRGGEAVADQQGKIGVLASQGGVGVGVAVDGVDPLHVLRHHMAIGVHAEGAHLVAVLLGAVDQLGGPAEAAAGRYH